MTIALKSWGSRSKGDGINFLGALDLEMESVGREDLALGSPFAWSGEAPLAKAQKRLRSWKALVCVGGDGRLGTVYPFEPNAYGRTRSQRSRAKSFTSIPTHGVAICDGRLEYISYKKTDLIKWNPHSKDFFREPRLFDKDHISLRPPPSRNFETRTSNPPVSAS